MSQNKRGQFTTFLRSRLKIFGGDEASTEQPQQPSQSATVEGTEASKIIESKASDTGAQSESQTRHHSLTKEFWGETVSNPYGTQGSDQPEAMLTQHQPPHTTESRGPLFTGQVHPASYPKEQSATEELLDVETSSSRPSSTSEEGSTSRSQDSSSKPPSITSSGDSSVMSQEEPYRLYVPNNKEISYARFAVPHKPVLQLESDSKPTTQDEEMEVVAQGEPSHGGAHNTEPKGILRKTEPQDGEGHISLACREEIKAVTFIMETQEVNPVTSTTDPNRYRCPYCWKGFKKLHQLRYHEKKHTGTLDYHCIACGRPFTTFQHFKAHN